jgi:hypothetical protein
MTSRENETSSAGARSVPGPNNATSHNTHKILERLDRIGWFCAGGGINSVSNVCANRKTPKNWPAPGEQSPAGKCPPRLAVSMQNRYLSSG